MPRGQLMRKFLLGAKAFHADFEPFPFPIHDQCGSMYIG